LTRASRCIALAIAAALLAAVIDSPALAGAVAPPTGRAAPTGTAAALLFTFGGAP
jgi:hypothetical protein